MEIEVKAKFDDKEEVKQKLRDLGAVEKKQKHQIDEYYNHPNRDTRETKEYLRLRYKPEGTKGIFAYHVNIADGVNKEFEVEVDNLETFKQILEGLNFPLLGTIDKKRETFELDGLSVTIDEVKDVDNFIEVEADGEESEIEQKKKECIEMLEKIGIPKENVCDKIWLCDIATGKITYP